MITVDFSNRQSLLPFSEEQLKVMLSELLQAEGFESGELSVSIVDEREMHELNREYLGHDYHTDVLSFVFDRAKSLVTGEIIVSAAMAIERCEEFDWTANDELSLYLIHGALHIVGYDDKQEADREEMRRREDHYLERFRIGANRQTPVGVEQKSTKPNSPAADGNR